MSFLTPPKCRPGKLLTCLFLLALALLFNGHRANGQNGTIDSVLKAKVDMLNDSSLKASFLDIQLIYDLSNQALVIAQQIGYKEGEGKSLTQLGSYYFNRERYDEALRYFFKSIDILKQEPSPELLIDAYAQVIWMFLYIKSPDKALKYIEILRTMVAKYPNVKNTAQYYLNLGHYYFLQGNYDLALTNQYYTLYLYLKLKSILYASRSYRFLGDTWIKKKNYEAALFNYREAVKLLYTNNSLADVAILYTRIAHVYQLMNNPEQVLNYELKALKIREAVGQVEFITLSNTNVGSAYMRMNRLDEAEPYLMKGLRMARQIGKTVLLESSSHQLFEFMKRKRRFKEAIAFYREFTDNRLQLMLEQNKNEITIMEANRMVVEAETKNALLIQEKVNSQLEMRNSRLKTLGTELVFLALLILIQFFYSLYRKNNRRKAELQSLNKRLESEISERQEAMVKMKQSEELYRFLAEHSSDVISRLNKDHGRDYISPSCKKLYGFDPEEMLAKKSIYELIDPEWHEEVRQRYTEMENSKRPSIFHYKARRKDGSLFWAESYVNPLFDPLTGELKEMITVVRDISERKKTEEAIAENARQKEILLREIHNRVKNNFAILVSLMTMQRELITNPVFSRSITDLQLRVRTMSLVHEQLYESQGISAIPFGEYLFNLSMIVANSYKNDRISMATNIAPCDLPFEMVMPLGLIVNELLTNAYKYAFPGDRSGTIVVELHPSSDQRWELIISDNGVGLPDNFFNENSRSMGMQIVHILVQQIEATLGIGSEHGSRFRIVFATF